MQSEVLDVVDDPGLKAYAVWEPILRTDDERAARKATTLFDDDRIEQYWVDSKDLGRAFQPAIELKFEPAWDVYLVYDRGVTWGDSPPEPGSFMHQLGGRLPEDHRLDGDELAERVREALSR